MKNLLVLAQKGGVGKTTIADNLAFMLEADGHNVNFYDMDPQGGALHQTKDEDNADFAVFDTPGQLIDETKELITDADLVIIPTRASALDMPPLERTRELVATVNPKVPVVIVLNGFNRWTNAKDFKEWLEEDLRSTESIAVLSQSERVPQAAIENKGIVAYAPKSRPSEELKELYAKVVTILGK